MADESQKMDVIVVGGGPAGISAACWCADLGLTVTVIDAGAQLGGQLFMIHNPVRNYPGLDAENGRVIAEAFEATAGGFEITRVLNSTIKEIDTANLVVRASDGREFSAKAVVLATGVRRRRLGVPGEAELSGRGILASGSGERDTVKGKRLVVVGGGDAAIENALILADAAAFVTVVHRRDTFTARPEMLNALSAKSNVETLLGWFVNAFEGEDRLENVRLSNTSGEIRSVAVDAAVVRIGYEPNSKLLLGKADTDKRGYVIADHDCLTSEKMVYAAGDVANPIAPTIAAGVGDGARAAKHIYKMLKAGTR